MTDPADARLRLVIPCYNESRRLRPDSFLSFVRSRRDTSLLFVDDGSTDATGAMLAALSAQAPDRVEVLTLPRNAGKAAAVQNGIARALQRAPGLVGYWDADLSTPLDALPQFLEVLDTRPRIEIVIGSRVKLLGRHVERNEPRHYLGRVFATAASLALGLAVYDTQCGAKVFRASEAVAAAFARPFRSGWVFDVELLARYVAAVGHDEARARIYELPLQEWIEVPGSKVKPWHALEAAWDLARIAVALRRGCLR